MAHQLGHNQYGKAETRVVRVYRDIDPHEIADYNVSAALSGDFADTHLTGDNAKVLTTDGVKNTVNAFAKEHGEAARQPESFALALARHFVEDVPQVSRARVKIEAYQWQRLDADTSPDEFVTAREKLAAVIGSEVDTAACPLGRYDRRSLRDLRRLGYRRVFTSDRRPARPDAWLQPRYSLRRGDTAAAVREIVLGRPSLSRRIWSAGVGLVKRWR